MQNVHKKKSLLRQEYERFLGKAVSDRTWRRMKTHLCISDEENIHDLSVVRGAAYLRSLAPYAKVRYVNAYNYGLIVEHFHPQGCSRVHGKDLAIAIQTCFRDRRGRSPRRETLWKWGVRMASEYGMDDVKLILGKLYKSGRYHIVENPPKVRQIFELQAA